MKLIFGYKRPILSSLVLIGLSLVCILAGCEIEDRLGETEETTGKPTEGIATLVFPTTTIMPTTTYTLETKNPIILWLPPEFDPANGSPEGTLLTQRLNDFVSENPSVLLEVRIKPASGRGGLLDSLEITKTVAPANSPSLILLSRQDFETAAIAELIYPINPTSAPFEGPDWFSFAKELAQVDGDPFGFPFAADMLVMAQRTEPTDLIDLTWQDVSINDKVLAFPGADLSALIPMAIYQSFGGDFWNEDGKPDLDAEILLNTYKILQNGSYFGSFPYWLTEYGTFAESWDAYQQDQADLAITWVSNALNNPSEETSFSNLPANGETLFTYTTGWLLCIANPTSEGTGDSLRLAEYLMDASFQSDWTEAAGYLPANRSALTAWDNIELASMLNEIAETGILLPTNEVLFGTGIIFKESTNDLLNQRVTADQAVEQSLQKIQPQD